MSEVDQRYHIPDHITVDSMPANPAVGSELHQERLAAEASGKAADGDAPGGDASPADASPAADAGQQGESSSKPEDALERKALAPINLIDEKLDALRKKYGGVVFDVSTAAGMKDAKLARTTISKLAAQVEQQRSSIVSTITRIQRKVNEQAAGIKSSIEEIKRPIDLQIKAEEERIERERQEKLNAEARRRAAMQAAIDEIKAFGDQAIGATADRISELKAGLASLVLEPGVLEERLSEAIALRASTIDRLNVAHAAALREERIKAENEELRRQLEEMRAQIAALAPRQHDQQPIVDAAPKLDFIPHDVQVGGVGEVDNQVLDVPDAQPDTDAIVHAVALHFGVNRELAIQYIKAAAAALI